MLEVFAANGFQVRRSIEAGVFHLTFPTGETPEVARLSYTRERTAAAASIRSLLEPRSVAVVGAYVAALGGIDAVVFTGGIGEHAPPIRTGICEGLGALGIELDAERNANTVGTTAAISALGARVGVYVIRSDEERVIAAEAARVLNAACSPPSG